MKIVHVVGARPNFMKVAPVVRAISEYPRHQQILVHTGQHYDANMSDIFFEQLGIRKPDVSLEVGSGSHASQTAQIMIRFETVIMDEKPDWVLVYGDVNSTVAAALVCSKLGIRIAHVEAGLRSFDRTMPEEINRMVTDRLADLLFTPSKDGDDNLLREGVDAGRIRCVGNVMIDTLVRLESIARDLWPSLRTSLGLDRYGLLTLHRPSNVDNDNMLRVILETLDRVSSRIPLLFPVHPRTRDRIRSYGLENRMRRVRLLDPLGYIEFLALQKNAAFVVTDSGGIQEETTFLGVPCLTLRKNTERPITIEMGTNVLVGQDMQVLQSEIERILRGDTRKASTPPLWDGHASERIAECLDQQTVRE